MSATSKFSPFNTQKLKQQLEGSGLHQFGLLLSKFEQLPFFVLILFGALLMLMIGFPWHLLSNGRFTLSASLVFAIILLIDAIFLINLPLKRISFGPWKSQWLQLSFLRMMGASGVTLIALLFPFESLPISLLRNEWRTIDFGQGAKIGLLGMDCTHELPYDTAVLDKLMPQAPQNTAQILLYHSPEIMPQVAEKGFDLYLCGHTHGGQVRLPIYGAILTSSQLGKRFVMGHYQIGRTHLYVSRGIGLEGQSAPRVRFLCPPEITLVTLSGAA